MPLWTPHGVVYGIRHKRLFGFLSRAGDVTDAISALDGIAPFPDDSFKRVGWPNQTTARIADPEGNLAVDCSIDGLVLTVNVEERPFPADTLRTMFKQLVRVAFPLYGGDDFVNRIGFVEQYRFERDAPAKVAVELLTRLGEIGTPGDFKFRAAFRHSTERGVAMKRVDDWKNTIIEVVSEKQGHDTETEGQNILRVSIDHQIYFVPELELDLALIDRHYQDTVEQLVVLQETYLAGLAPANVRDGG